MSVRREARERAVQFLFQQELNPAQDVPLVLEWFWASQARGDGEKDRAQHPEESPAAGPNAEEAAVRLFANALIRGVLEHLERLDEIIIKYSKNWGLHRMAVIDRNILRLAIYEMVYCEDIPPVVSINEAVDIAKKYSTEGSGKFVNGILDKVKNDLMRPARTSK